MAVGRLFLCLFLIVKVTDDICRKNISTYAACNSNKEIDNVGHDSTSSLSEDIYVNWTLLFRCDSITAYYPSHIAENETMVFICTSILSYQRGTCQPWKNKCSNKWDCFGVFVLHDENLPYIPHFRSSYRTNDQFALDGENLTSSIPKIISPRKIEKISNKREKNIIEPFQNWCCIVLNQRKTLKFMRLLRLRRKIYGKNSQTNIQLWYCREQSAHQIGIQSYRMWHRRQRWTTIHRV